MTTVHTSVHYTPHARARLTLRRLRRSGFARDIRAAWRSTFWVRVLSAGLLLGLYVAATRHTYLDWSGFHAINGGIR